MSIYFINPQYDRGAGSECTMRAASVSRDESNCIFAEVSAVHFTYFLLPSAPDNQIISLVYDTPLSLQTLGDSYILNLIHSEIKLYTYLMYINHLIYIKD